MYNRFGGPKACKQCPGIPMYVRVSANNGVSWGPETYLCQCSGVKWQYDPVLKVASNGVVYATFMNGYDMMFSKSTDHAATWSTPIEVSAKPWGDKPWIGVSPNGTDVYIAYETTSDVWVAASHNGGTSFAAAVKLNTDSGRYRYPNGLEVLPNGTALLSASSYPGSQQQSGAIDIEIWRTTNGGTSWTRTVLATPFSGVTWETSSTTALASDAAGNLVALYTGATVLGGNGHVWTRRSTDSGATWAAAVEIGNGSANASFPAIAGGASGVFRLHYADNRTGSWNAYYRSSTDGGQTWSAEADISDADTGATYKTAAGFTSEYGDYGAIDVTNTGKTVAVWGEGASFSNGPEGSGSTACSEISGGSFAPVAPRPSQITSRVAGSPRQCTERTERSVVRNTSRSTSAATTASSSGPRNGMNSGMRSIGETSHATANQSQALFLRDTRES